MQGTYKIEVGKGELQSCEKCRAKMDIMILIRGTVVCPDCLANNFPILAREIVQSLVGTHV